MYWGMASARAACDAKVEEDGLERCPRVGLRELTCPEKVVAKIKKYLATNGHQGERWLKQKTSDA